MASNAQAIIKELKSLGNEGYRRIILNHGAADPCFGVKISELQKIRKRVKQDYRLALDLYDTGIYDAMYLAGLIADDLRMTTNDLQKWALKASRPLAGSTVAWVAASSAHGWDLAMEWIDAKTEMLAVAGWATLSSLVSIKADADLNLAKLRALLSRVQKNIHTSPNEVRKQMNGFVIAVGSYVAPLKNLCLETGEKIGPVSVDVGNTDCQIPFSPDYIKKVEARGSLGKKRKTAKC